MTRQRVAPVAPAADPEPVLARTFTLPTTRTFRSDRHRPDQLDGIRRHHRRRWWGAPGRARAGWWRTPRNAFPATSRATASAALDGNPTTMWSPGLGAGNQKGAWIQVNRPRSSTVDHLDLVVAADGYHSVPTALRVQACDQLAADRPVPDRLAPSANVTFPPVADGRRRGATAAVPVHFPAVTGRDLTITVTGVRLETTRAIFGSPGPDLAPARDRGARHPRHPRSAPAPPTFSATCRSNLLTVDGQPVSVSLSGSTAGALAGERLTVTPCGPDAAGITLGAGQPRRAQRAGRDHRARHRPAGTRLGAGREVPTPRGAADGAPLSAPTPGPAPDRARHVVDVDEVSAARSPACTRPYWLVLGQSINKGWKATVDGSGKDLGPATLIDGFGNGWLVQPTGATHHVGHLALDAADRARTWRCWCPHWLSSPVSSWSSPPCVDAGGRGRDRALADAADAGLPAAAPSTTTSVDPEGDDVPTLGNPFAPATKVSPGLAAIVAAVCGLGAGVLVPQAVFFEVFLGVAVGVAAGADRAAPARAAGSRRGGLRRGWHRLHHRLAEDPTLRLGRVADPFRSRPTSSSGRRSCSWAPMAWWSSCGVVDGEGLARRGERPTRPAQRRASASSTRAPSTLAAVASQVRLRGPVLAPSGQGSRATRCR